MDDDQTGPERDESKGDAASEVIRRRTSPGAHSAASIAARSITNSPAFHDLSKQMAAAQANSIGAIANPIAAGQRSVLGKLSAQIAATQTQSLSTIAARSIADSPAFHDLSKQMEASRAAVLGELASFT